MTTAWSMRRSLRLSTTSASSSGPPSENDALILVRPRSGTSTKESRGIETSWADCRSPEMCSTMIASLRNLPGVQVSLARSSKRPPSPAGSSTPISRMFWAPPTAAGRSPPGSNGNRSMSSSLWLSQSSQPMRIASSTSATMKMVDSALWRRTKSLSRRHGPRFRVRRTRTRATGTTSGAAMVSACRPAVSRSMQHQRADTARGTAWSRCGQEALLIIPAPTVIPVASSMRMNDPVVRFLL